MVKENLDILIEQLSDRKSSKRRSAAKKLRKLADPMAGPFLQSALEKELKDERTWETQYQIIMAIGHCGYKAAKPFIESLVSRKFVEVIYNAIGDTLLRLSRKDENDADVALKFIKSGNRSLIQGAIQAIAMLRMIPKESMIQELVNHGKSLKLGEDDWTVVWLLRAVPGWPKELVVPLIKKWGEVEFKQQQQIHGAVDLARKQKYSNWSPL